MVFSDKPDSYFIDMFKNGNVANLDETGCFYDTMSRYGLVRDYLQSDCFGMKTDKRRFTCTTTITSDGKILPLQVIYTSKIPICANSVFGVTRQDFGDYTNRWFEKTGLHYCCSTRGWQTSDTFQTYLKRLCTEFKKRNQLEILLFIDNAPSHKVDHLYEYDGVSLFIMRLPPRTTVRVSIDQQKIVC